MGGVGRIEAADCAGFRLARILVLGLWLRMYVMSLSMFSDKCIPKYSFYQYLSGF